MKKLVINGGKSLFGEVEISSAKNACLPLVSAALAFGKEVYLQNVPKIADVAVMCELARGCGCTCLRENDNLYINAKNASFLQPNERDFKQIRASLFFLGSSLARFKKAVIFKPGGCDIGARPIDIHLCGLQALGARYLDCGEKYVFNGENMHSGTVFLRFPSVGATINLIEAALFLKGETVIKNAAREPEIVCLCEFLNACGFKIFGAGSHEIVVLGVKKTRESSVSFKPVYDRIEAATFMAAVCVCGGEILLKTQAGGVKKFVEAVKAAGATVFEKPLSLGFAKAKNVGSAKNANNEPCAESQNLSEFIIKSNGNLRAITAVADVYPALATDMQPLLAALLIKAEGVSTVLDNVYPARFLYAEQLKKFGAEIEKCNGGVRIRGVKKLEGATVTACDLRGGAALAVAALASDGQSVVLGAEKICRGYESFAKKLRFIGANAKYSN